MRHYRYKWVSVMEDKLDFEDGTWYNFTDADGNTWHIKKHPMFDNTPVDNEDQGR